MAANTADIIQITLPTELRRSLEASAAKLNLTLAAYVLYLITREQPGKDAPRLDKMVQEVFGRYGPAMRKLAQ